MQTEFLVASSSCAWHVTLTCDSRTLPLLPSHFFFVTFVWGRVCDGERATAHTWKSEDTFESQFFPSIVGSGD